MQQELGDKNRRDGAKKRQGCGRQSDLEREEPVCQDNLLGSQLQNKNCQASGKQIYLQQSAADFF